MRYASFQLVLELLLIMLLLLHTASSADFATATCGLGDLTNLVGLNLSHIRLTIGCYSAAENSTSDSLPLAARLSSVRPASAPAAADLADEARLALAALRPGRDRLRRLSLGGLRLGDRLPDLLPTLRDFPGLEMVNLTDVGADRLPAGLLRWLPRLRRIEAGGNSLDCARPENRWADLLARLGSDLLAPAPQLACPPAAGGNDTAASAAGNSTVDIDTEPTVSLMVDLHGDLRLPCSATYFRVGDVGLWTPDALVVWQRIEPDGGLTFRLTGNGSSVLYLPSSLRFASRLWVGPASEGAPLVISGLRQAVAGEWRCVLSKEEAAAAVRHRLVLRPPLASVEVACYIVAATISVIMVLIGLFAAFIRGMIRTHCCTRVVHIVEAQSVLHLDASPQQSRRRWQEAAAATATASGGGGAGLGGDNYNNGAPPASAFVLVDASEAGILGDFAGPSGSAGAAGWRDRLRDINDQMRLHVTSFGESVGSTMRAGWSNGVEHMKEQMRSVAEFCGTNGPLGQTVSVVSVYTDPEGRQEPMEQHLHLLSSV